MNVLLDFSDQFFDALEGSPSDSPLCDEVEPDLDLVEP